MPERDPLRALLSAAPFGIALVDADLRYLEVNAYLAGVHGLPIADHPGRSVREVVPGVAGEMERHARRVLDTGEPVEEVRLRGPAPGGDRACEWLVGLYPVRDAGGAVMGVGAVVLDVTEQTATAEELSRRTRQQATVARFGQRALAGAPLEALFDEAAHLAAQTLGVEFGEVLELVHSEGVLVLRAGVGWREGLLGVGIPATTRTQAGTVVCQAAPVVVENLREDRRFHAVGELRDHGIESGASVPIESAGELQGVLAAHSTRRFSVDDVAFLQALANVLGAAIERSRAEARLRDGAHRLSLALQAGRLGTWEWHQATGAVRWSPTLEAIYGLGPGEFGGTFADYAARLHPEDRDWVLATVEAAAQEERELPEMEHRIVLPDGSERWISGTGGPLRGPDGRVTGMLGLAKDVTDRRAADEERAALLRAERAARAETEAARERLAFLADVTAALGTTLDVRELLERVTTLAVGDFADGCSVDLVEDTGLRRAVLHHRDPAKALAYHELRRRYPPRAGSGNFLLRVLETREALIVPEVPDDFYATMAEDDAHLALLRAAAPRSGMCVPLVARGRVLGLLSFVRDEPGAYDEQSLEVARDLGRRLALEIDNVRLFQERTEGERRFRRLADTLQASLLPPSLPEIPGLELASCYRPAARGLEVGGDFYDVFPLPGRQWGMVVGDVCGKGPEAAALTAFARHTLRAAAMQERSPSAAIGVLNDAVRADVGDSGRFLTLAFLRLRRTRVGLEAAVALGGHPQPLLLRADGRVEAVGVPGSLVGVLPDPEFSDSRVVLDPGDTLVSFTDGVPDARSGVGSFGEDRLMELVAECAGLEPRKLLDRVEHALHDFSSGIARDDVAMLAVRVTP